MLKLELSYLHSINLAMQQNEKSIIRQLSIFNDSDSSISDLTLTITLDLNILSPIIMHIAEIPSLRAVELSDLNFELPVSYLKELSEPLNTSLLVEVKNNADGILLSNKYPLRVLPANYWPGIDVLPELTAAFVTPNTSSINEILKPAAAILKQWTGDPTFDGYNSKNANRVLKQMAAIYEAIVQQRIVYCSPPPYYEKFGQRIRLCDSIINDKIATCLDVALLYASCIEAIGLNPLIAVIKGHAFAGAWLVDECFADGINDDESLLLKKMAEGINEIVMLETTCMLDGHYTSFDNAQHVANDILLDGTNFILSIDVKRCRYAEIAPLPFSSQIELSVSSSHNQADDLLQIPPGDRRVDKFDMHIVMPDLTKLQVWERKLLDLSLRNNLLNLRITRNTLQLLTPPLDNFEETLRRGVSFKIVHKPIEWKGDRVENGIYQSITKTDPVNELIYDEFKGGKLRCFYNESDLKKSLTSLYRSSRVALEENGANTLYVAFGLLKWYESDVSEKARYAPILMLPVEIIKKSATSDYAIRWRDEGVMLNVTLLEMLRQDFDINIVGLQELIKEEGQLDINLIFNVVRQQIMNKKRWNVEELAFLGIFSFNKFIMWHDIHHNSETLYDNLFVRSLMSGCLEWDIEETHHYDLDSILKPSDIALPIKADSYQIDAVCNADAGRSFILHGPPGTGKSQTITNIIANALFKGKRVLFVAEKKAALDVVQKRLAEIGIDAFCLELHSNKASKTEVVNQLRKTVEASRLKSSDDFMHEARQLYKLRSELAEHMKCMHTKHLSGLSLYDALSNYCEIEDTKGDFTLPTDFAKSVTAERLAEYQVFTDELQLVVTICGTIHHHPFRNLKIENYTYDKADILKEILQQRVELLKQLKVVLDELTPLIAADAQVGSIYSLDLILSIITLLQSNDINADFLDQPDITLLCNRLKSVVAHGRRSEAIKQSLMEQFHEELLSFQASEYLSRYRTSRNCNSLKRWFVSWMICRKLKSYARDKKSLKMNHVEKVLCDIIDYQNERTIIDDEAMFGKSFLGELWNKWDRIEDNCATVLALENAYINLYGSEAAAMKAQQYLAKSLIRQRNTYLSLHQPLFAEYKKILGHLSAIENDLVTNYGLLTTNKNWLENALEETTNWLHNFHKLKDWANWCRLKENGESIGLRPLMIWLDTNTTRNLKDLLFRAIYKSIIQYITDNDASLSYFRGILFEDKIRRYRDLTSEFQRITRQELYIKLVSGLPNFVKEASQSSEIGILQRNINNRCRGISLRRLFDSIPRLFPKLTPCMLMSPISVAQYLDTNHDKFDLLIFDEASQIPTSEAVGAIARAKNVIVVGDPQQMPPSNFFASQAVNEDDIENEDLESILDDCLALSMPSSHLLCHYRSKHESLIAFSNTHYYENKLFTFPSPDNINAKVTYQAVDGFYDRAKTRQNRAEAEAIVAEVVMRLNDSELRMQSMGIIAFSAAQQSLIEDLLNDAFVNQPLLEEHALASNEPIFIKNLENVQGDERDVILFSIGYGRDSHGNISFNFGPLNRLGGERRLNVAITRARYEMKVFSIMTADQIDLSRTTSKGVAGLKAFLAFAQSGRMPYVMESDVLVAKQEGLLMQIAQRITELGYDVHTNVGCSGYRIDIGVVDPLDPSRYKLGILCDGYNYCVSRTVADREVIHVDVLKQLGWCIMRVWALDWLENKEAVLKSITDNLDNRSVKEVQESVEGNTTIDAPTMSVDEAPSLDSEAGEESTRVGDESRDSKYYSQYVRYNSLPCNINPDEFRSTHWKATIRKQILEILSVEAPISIDLLIHRVLAIWQIPKTGARLNVYISNLVYDMKIKQTYYRHNNFLWNKLQDPSTFMNYRCGLTDIHDIAPEEISVAVREVVEKQFSLLRTDLIKETARLLGFTRVTDNIEAIVNLGIDVAIKRGLAASKGDRVNVV